ncbi:MAG: hypothetical protein PUP93_05355 [Rhizonema sp. NSF051]|nr:hypothetical protein [Rhizonema sp. NSF051]
MQLLNQESKKTNILPFLAVGTFGLNIFALLVLTFHGSLLQQLNRKNAMPSLVQLVDGSAITVESQPNLERNPETIRRFVGETMTLMMTWSPKQPQRIVQQISSDLLANGFRQKFEKEISNLTPDNQSTGTESVLVLQRVSQPTKIEDGKWRVEMLANQLSLTSFDPLGNSTPFNKQILVRVRNDQETPVPSPALPLNLAVHRVGEARLEIYNICDIKEKNCS